MKPVIGAVSIVGLALAAAHELPAQTAGVTSNTSAFIQRGPKLVGSGAIGAAQQGYSVGLSADGNTAIIGCALELGDSPHPGAAWVFTRGGGVWTEVALLRGSGATGLAAQGASVALSADGNTAIIGGPHDGTQRRPKGDGAAWVFTRSGEGWTQQGLKLVGSGAVGLASQGYSVALSADGNTAIVGGYGDTDELGAAWVFTRKDGVWTQQGRKLLGSGAVGDAQQGFSVALSADGNTAIVGGPKDNRYAGAAWVFIRTNDVWAQQGRKLIGSGAGSGDTNQGWSVALSADGNTAILGGVSDNRNAGAAWVFARKGGVWTQLGNKLVGSGAVGDAGQGWSVALSGDGNTAIVTGPSDNRQTGAAWVFTRKAGVWAQLGDKLVGSGAVGNASQGSSVALSADGNTAIVGAIGDGMRFNTTTGQVITPPVGAAWVFSKQ